MKKPRPFKATDDQLVRLYEAVSEALEREGGAGVVRDVEAQYGDGGDGTRQVARMLRRLEYLRTPAAAAGKNAVQKACARIAAKTGERASRAFGLLALFAGGGPGGKNAVCGPKPRCGQCGLQDECPRSRKGPTVKHLPKGDRPREKLLLEGADALSDAELLAILLRTGTQKRTVIKLAEHLLREHGGVPGLGALGAGMLTKTHGLGPAKAAQILAALELGRRLEKSPSGARIASSLDVMAYFKRKLRRVKKERFYAVLLDNKHRVIREVQVSEGSLTTSIVHPRETFAEAVREAAAKVIFVHNHPSGDPEPSREDIEITDRLKEAGDVLGIGVLDHVIVGAEGYVSFAERGML